MAGEAKGKKTLEVLSLEPRVFFGRCVCACLCLYVRV